MILIEKNADKLIKWDIVRAEYIGGGTSYRKLCAKYKVSLTVLKKRAKSERWPQLREEVKHKTLTIATQKTAEVNADNATIAARIKTKLLIRLEKEIDRLPESIGSESTNTAVEYGKNDKGSKMRKEASKSYKLRDLTAAYKDLTDDMTLADNSGNELLQSLLDLERKIDRG